LGLVDNILKVGQNWSMGRCPISNMIFVDLKVIFLRFYPGFQLQYFTWKCYQWHWIIPYTISRATLPKAPCCSHLDSHTSLCFFQNYSFFNFVLLLVCCRLHPT